MSTIKVTRHHQLNHEQAVAAADDLARSLAKEYHVECEWHGDVMRFHRRGAKGEMRVEPSSIHVEMELGFLLSAFRDRIEQEIHRHLDGLLEQGTA